MNRLCSVIIPSRGRPEGLVTAIRSITRNADQPGNIEVLVGLDEDDSESLPWIERIESYPNTTVYVGKREPVCFISYRLLAEAKGTWAVFFNDDATLVGPGWDMELAKHPVTGFILQPEIHKLGGSTYYQDRRSGFPWFPISFWNDWRARCGNHFTPEPSDVGIPKEALEIGWQIGFLKGVTVAHDGKER